MTARTLCEIEGVPVLQYPDGRVVFDADADIDADGAPRAYHQTKRALDLLANAGGPGNWWGIATDTGEPDGTPVVQGKDQPAPGYYVSTTAYEHNGLPHTDQRRYLNSEAVPFIVVAPQIRRLARGIVLGCQARATHVELGRTVDCLVGDIGPTRRIGELSIAAATALGIPHSPRTGGEKRRVIRYTFWPGKVAKVDGVSYRLIRA